MKLARVFLALFFYRLETELLRAHQGSISPIRAHQLSPCLLSLSPSPVQASHLPLDPTLTDKRPLGYAGADNPKSFFVSHPTSAGGS